MKQILQNLRNGKIELVELHTPRANEGHVLIQTKTSLISAGTERMLLEFCRANLVNKTWQQHEKVRSQGIKANPAITKRWSKKSACPFQPKVYPPLLWRAILGKF